ncbi:MAG: hypothetical protein DRI81_00715 [Chloroflexi bacterium]|nr:MAG: hypothetical protein DRI81_00715 [Chloroflexota bacterium]
MAYCDVTDVEQLMQTKFTLSGHPTPTDVEEFVDFTAANLDGVIQASGYATPVTVATAIALLKKYNSFGAAVAVWHAGYVSDTAPARVEYWQEQYNGFISRVRRGEQELPGLTPTSDLQPAFEIVAFPERV